MRTAPAATLPFSTAIHCPGLGPPGLSSQLPDCADPGVLFQAETLSPRPPDMMPQQLSRGDQQDRKSSQGTGQGGGTEAGVGLFCLASSELM